MEQYLRCGAPDVAVLVADDVELVGMITVLDGGARRGSVRVSDDRCERRGRTILLTSDVFRFLCRQRRISVDGRRGTWDKIIKVGVSGSWVSPPGRRQLRTLGCLKWKLG